MHLCLKSVKHARLHASTSLTCTACTAAEGICTARGGMTSHAAVVARGWGKPCVAGCEALCMDEKEAVSWRAEGGDGATC